MRLRSFVAVLAALVFFLIAKPASAQAVRTWVSGVGDDANPCSRTAPCKTFAGAISKTAAAGIINVLDPGGYGAVTITKSITIDGRKMAGVLASGSNGIIVNAGANDTVTLRGLSVEGVGTGLTGIRFLAGKSLHVADTTITGFTTAGLDAQPTAAASVSLERVVATGNAKGLLAGGLARISITKSQFFDNPFGLHARGSARVAVHDSVFTGSTDKGIFAEATSEVNVDRGLVSGNNVGVQGDAPVRLSEVMVAHNTVGLAGAQVISFGNNRVAAGNETNGNPSQTLPQQ